MPEFNATLETLGFKLYNMNVNPELAYTKLTYVRPYHLGGDEYGDDTITLIYDMDVDVTIKIELGEKEIGEAYHAAICMEESFSDYEAVSVIAYEKFEIGNEQAHLLRPLADRTIPRTVAKCDTVSSGLSELEQYVEWLVTRVNIMRSFKAREAG